MFVHTTSIPDVCCMGIISKDAYTIVILTFNMIFMLSSIHKQRNNTEAIISSTTAGA